MNNLIAGRSRSSTHLHKIARELETTPAFLSGETDDPDAAVQDGATSYQDRQHLDQLRFVSAEGRQLIDQLTQLLANLGQNQLALQLPGEVPLTAMFEALLAGIRPSLPEAEKARLLAQRLPIGLSHLQHLRPGSDTVASDALGEDQPTPHHEQTR